MADFEALIQARDLGSFEAALGPLLDRIDTPVDPVDRTLLHLATRADWLDGMKVLLVAGARANPAESGVSQPLHLARSGPAVDMLVEHGAELDARDNVGFTPLHRAAEEPDRVGALRALLQRGAMVDARSHQGVTPMIWAATRHDAPDVVDLLIEHGAAVDAVKPDGDSALHQSARKGHHRVAERLLAAGADPERRDDSGFSVLEVAIMSDRPEENDRVALIRHLVDAGVDVLGRSAEHDEHRPFELAHQKGRGLELLWLLTPGGLAGQRLDAYALAKGDRLRCVREGTESATVGDTYIFMGLDDDDDVLLKRQSPVFAYVTTATPREISEYFQFESEALCRDLAQAADPRSPAMPNKQSQAVSERVAPPHASDAVVVDAGAPAATSQPAPVDRERAAQARSVPPTPTNLTDRNTAATSITGAGAPTADATAAAGAGQPSGRDPSVPRPGETKMDPTRYAWLGALLAAAAAVVFPWMVRSLG